MKVLCVMPNFNGHFLNYTNLIKLGQKQKKDSTTVIRSTAVFKIIWFLLANFNKKKRIIFLHGDRDVLLALLLKLLFPFTSSSAVIYYSYHDVGLKAKSYVKRAILIIASYVGVRLLLLEVELKNRIWLKRGNVTRLYDPVLLSGPMAGSQVDRSNVQLRYLVAGYLDERKLVPLLVKILIKLNQNSKVKRKLVLLGVQSAKVQKFLKKQNSNNLEVEIKNYRYEDKELEKELSECDVVWCVYENHYGSSGMVINAIQYGKKVIYTPVGVLSSFSKELGIGGMPLSQDEVSLKDYLMKIEHNGQYLNSQRNEFLDKRNQVKFVNTILENA